MDTACPECGARVPSGSACLDHFHALLVLEGTFPSAPGSILHFYAVATYNLQRPDSSGLTAEALHGSYQSLADVLDGKLSLELLRRQVRRTADGPTRVRRRQGEPPVGWYRGPWPINVVNVLTATAATYPEFVEAWAHAVRATLDAQLLTTTQPR